MIPTLLVERMKGNIGDGSLAEKNVVNAGWHGFASKRSQDRSQETCRELIEFSSVFGYEAPLTTRCYLSRDRLPCFNPPLTFSSFTPLTVLKVIARAGRNLHVG